jgi:phytoene dehydrogenase-like protein
MLEEEYLPEKIKYAYENWPLFTPLIQVSFGINDIVSSEAHNTNYICEKAVNFGHTKTHMYNIMNRSQYDRTFAPEGKTTLLLQVESPWEIWENLQGKEYGKEKRLIRDTALAELEKRYPGISEKVETIDVATPRTTVHYTGVWKGAYEGFMPSTDVMNGLPMELEGLSNFKMIGQWLYPGGGLPPAAQSGKWAIQKIVKERKLEFAV